MEFIEYLQTAFPHFYNDTINPAMREDLDVANFFLDAGLGNFEIASVKRAFRSRQRKVFTKSQLNTLCSLMSQTQHELSSVNLHNKLLNPRLGYFSSDVLIDIREHTQHVLYGELGANARINPRGMLLHHRKTHSKYARMELPSSTEKAKEHIIHVQDFSDILNIPLTGYERRILEYT